jgi:nitrate reductase gamma subunit
MKAVYALIVVVALTGAGLASGASAALRGPLGVIVPYTACVILLAGICLRVWRWAATPVPFRIPTTCGQQKSLSWIPSAPLENPSSGIAAASRLGLEILLFRSLFRNTRYEVSEGRAIFGDSKLLWLGAMAFHWSMLLILLRHLRLFIEPVPAFVLMLQRVDGFFQIGVPELYLSDIAFTAGLLYLLWRRFGNPLVRYISQVTDYLALFLLLGVAVTGMMMRHVTKVDVAAIKQFALGLVTFSPVMPLTVGALFFAHLFLVSALAAYFPFSKLMHVAGVFLSPTRNLANNSRMVRHVNPWNYPVKKHTYTEWEEEYRDKLIAADIPMETPDVRAAHTD